MSFDNPRPDDRCPRCGLLINGRYAGSRITADRIIDICGHCAHEEALFQINNPGRPLPSINEEMPVHETYGTD